MIVSVNGEQQELPEGINLDQLLKDIMQNSVRIAVEINREIIPKSNYTKCVLKNNDVIEIIKAVGGG